MVNGISKFAEIKSLPNKFLYFLFFIIVFAGCKEENNDVKFEGAYFYQYENTHDLGNMAHYIILQPDCTVYAISAKYGLDQVQKLYNEKNNILSVGKYSIKGKQIKFEAASSNGSVLYEGEIVDSTHLTLKVISNMNGHESLNNYIFIPFNK